MKAYRQVRSALANGALARPETCERCGRTSPPGSDGRTTIHAHHHDYSKPLEVEWLCVKCHRIETPLPTPRLVRPEIRGPGNGNSKLSWEQAAEIRNSGRSHRQLARQYGVERTAIRRIKQGKTYNAAPPPPAGES